MLKYDILHLHLHLHNSLVTNNNYTGLVQLLKHPGAAVDSTVLNNKK